MDVTAEMSLSYLLGSAAKLGFEMKGEKERRGEEKEMKPGRAKSREEGKEKSEISDGVKLKRWKEKGEE